jgi:D-lactate dehydrogenase (cytochrome)
MDNLLIPLTGEHEDYLRDESRRAGRADTLSFPRTEAELRAVLTFTYPRGIPVTLQGARTGITAGAVPDGGHVLNVSRMNRILGLRHDPGCGSFFVTVQPGLALTELRKTLCEKSFAAEGWRAESMAALARLRAAGPLFFPPDPTETSASLGGMAACNASGACSFHYGATRAYVEALRVILADGDALALRRGTHRARGRAFRVVTESGRVLEGRLPRYRMPAVKNASGYYAADDMDLIDLFIGAEGTLGALAEIELRLLPAPGAIWGVTAFLPSETAALRLVRVLRDEDRGEPARPPARKPVALEYFDAGALALLREQKRTNPAFQELPEIPAAFNTAVYVEYHGAEEAQVEEAVAALAERLAACDGSAEAAWIAAQERELERCKLFRHAVPEAVNLRIDERRKREPQLTKLSTDMAVPDGALEKVMALYGETLRRAGLEYVIFGHIGNNHVHINILPHTLADYEIGKALYLEWARQVIAMGGTVSAEHGVGKLKVALLREMYGAEGIEQMRAVKRIFDPADLLNRGNLF